MKKRYIFVVIITLIVVVLLGVFLPVLLKSENITSYRECVKAGNRILESYPEQCVTEQGVVFVNEAYDLESMQDCVVDSECIPLPSQCHPTSCINKEFESNFERPEMCTLIFMYEAAYSPEDCACQENVCVNKNLGRTTE